MAPVRYTRVRWMHRIAAVLAATFTLAVPLVAQQRAAAPGPDRLTLNDYLDWESVNNPQPSPDGTQIIYSRGWVDKVNDRRESDIWIMNADGSRKRFLLKGSNPQWSPDGTRIAFTAPGDPGGAQIWIRWMDAEGAT